jgi:hypothetical protein
MFKKAIFIPIETRNIHSKNVSVNIRLIKNSDTLYDNDSLIRSRSVYFRMLFLHQPIPVAARSKV